MQFGYGCLVEFAVILCLAVSFRLLSHCSPLLLHAEDPDGDIGFPG